MFVKNNLVFSEAGFYLLDKTRNIVGFKFENSSQDIEEIQLSTPLDISIDYKNKIFYFNNNLFMCKPKDLNYIDIKTQLINSRYNNNDQLAIMLNKDLDEQHLLEFQKMQEWRQWSGDVARLVEKIIKEKGVN